MEKILASCIHCKEVRLAKGIHTHVDREHLKLSKYSNGNNGSYHLLSAHANDRNNKLKSEYDSNPSFCIECEAKLDFSKRKNSFCNRSCSATYTNLKKDYTKIKTGPTKKEKILYNHICSNCELEFTSLKIEQKCCSRKCSCSYRNKHVREKRSALINYRADCAFKFSLNDYPDEFDFSLVEFYGWYKAKNKGNNLHGVSRDHMVSVRWGFDNNIPAYHLAHPANCRLVEHNKNVSKGSKNIITYEELLVRINEWDKKYPPSVHHNKVQ